MNSGPNKRAGETGPNTGRCTNQPFDERRKRLYLREIRRHGQRTIAAHKVGVSGQTVRNHEAEDEEFAERLARADDLFRESQIKELVRRSMRGTLKGVYHQGVRVDSERQYSDRLLELLIKANHPQYRDRLKVDQNTTHRGALGNVDLAAVMSSLDDEALSKLTDLLELMGGEDDAES